MPQSLCCHFVQKNDLRFFLLILGWSMTQSCSREVFFDDYCMVKCLFSGFHDSGGILGSGPVLLGVWMEMTGVRELMREQHHAAKTSCEPRRHTMSRVTSQETWTCSRTVRARSSTSLWHFTKGHIYMILNASGATERSRYIQTHHFCLQTIHLNWNDTTLPLHIISKQTNTTFSVFSLSVFPTAARVSVQTSK